MSWQRAAFALVVFALIVGITVNITRHGEDCSPRDLLRIDGPAEFVETPDGLSVIVSSDEGFTMGALFWILRIGDTEFSLSRYPDFSTNRIEFPIPDDALPRLQDGDGIGIRYGNPTPRRGSNVGGWAPAAENIDRGKGFVVLGVLEDCPS